MCRGRWLICAWLVGASSWAQTGTSLHGRVLNQNNAPVPGARVLLLCGDRRYQALPDAEGNFAVERSPSAACFVSVEAPGYYPVNHQPLDDAAEVYIRLVRIAERSETIDVSATPVALSLDTGPVSTRAAATDIVNAPYPNTNNLQSSLRILPGVYTGNRGLLHINGGAAEQTYYSLDGFDISDPLTARFESRFSPEAVQEVEVNSGALRAEFGRGSAGVLAVRTRSGTDRFIASATNFLPGVENRKGLIIGNFTPRLNLSGPLRRTRSWWSNATDLQYDQTVVPEIREGVDRYWSFRWSNLLSTQFNLTPANILYATAMVNGLQAPNGGLTAMDPLSTTFDRRSRQAFVSLRDQQYLGGGAVLEAGYAFNRTSYREEPQGTEPLFYTADGRRGNWFRDARQTAQRHQFTLNAFARTLHWRGSHLVKGGADLSYIDYSQNVARNTYFHLRADGSPIRRTEFQGPGALSRTSLLTSYFVQDSWRPRANLQVEGGLRWDYDRLVRRVNFAPRLSAAFSPVRHPNVKISGGFGLVYDVPNLQLFIRPLDQVPVVTYFAAGGQVARGPVAALFDLVNAGLNSPAFWTYTAGWEYRLPSNVSFAVNYLGKRGLRGLAFIPTFEPTDSSYRLANQRQDRVDSAEFTVRQNFRRQYGWMASYVRSSARSNAAVDITVDDPQNIANNSGPLSWDAPHRLLSWGYLPTLWENWALAYLVEYRSGFPFSIVREDGFLAGPANSRRYPNFLEANLHAEWKLTLFRHRWALRGGFNNLTGRRNPTLVNAMMGAPQFMTFYGGYGRAANFRIRWLGRE